MTVAACGSGEARTGRRQLAMTVAGEVAALIVVHALPAPRLDLTDPVTWMDRVGLETALAAVLRCAGIATTWWLLLATAAALLTARPTAGTARRLVRVVVPRRLGALADRAVAAGMLATVAVGPSAAGIGSGVAAAAEPGPAIVQRDADGTLLPPGLAPPDRPPDEATRRPPAASPPAPAAPPRQPTASPPSPAASPRQPTADHHVVDPGEHLWAIAARHLAAAWDRPVDSLGDHEIAPFWSRLVDANAMRLRSGDPDVLFPGEQVVVPPAPATPAGREADR